MSDDVIARIMNYTKILRKRKKIRSLRSHNELWIYTRIQCIHMVVKITTIWFSKISIFYLWFLEDLQERIEVMKYHLNYFYEKPQKPKLGPMTPGAAGIEAVNVPKWDAPRKSYSTPNKRDKIKKLLYWRGHERWDWRKAFWNHLTQQELAKDLYQRGK